MPGKDPPGLVQAGGLPLWSPLGLASYARRFTRTLTSKILKLSDRGHPPGLSLFEIPKETGEKEIPQKHEPIPSDIR
jgi:hypothetical protein